MFTAHRKATWDGCSLFLPELPQEEHVSAFDSERRDRTRDNRRCNSKSFQKWSPCAFVLNLKRNSVTSDSQNEFENTQDFPCNDSSLNSLRKFETNYFWYPQVGWRHHTCELTGSTSAGAPERWVWRLGCAHPGCGSTWNLLLFSKEILKSQRRRGVNSHSSPGGITGKPSYLST